MYGIALLALLHFFWMRAGKNDFAEWSIYAAILGVLLGWRLLNKLRASGPAQRQRVERNARIADPAG